MKKGEAANNTGKRNEGRSLLIIAILILISLGALLLPSPQKTEMPTLKVEEAASVTMWSVEYLDIGRFFSFLKAKPHLTLALIETGYMEHDVFTPSRTFRQNVRNAVRIRAVNEGNASTGMWTLIAELPTAPSYTYTNNTMPSLEAKEEKIFLLTFDHISDLSLQEKDDQGVTVYGALNNAN